MRKALMMAAALSLVGALAARADTPEITMVIYGTTGNPFWAKVVAGAEEAGKKLGAKVDIAFANDDPVQQNNIIETALARGTKGLGIVINVDEAYNGVVARARDAGVPVVAFNVDHSKGAAGNRRMAFIGQDFEVAGYLIGKTMAAKAHLGSGDKAVCPVEHPEATYAAKRHAGVEKALKEVGATCEMINTGGVGLEDTLTKLTQYLLANPKTKAVVGLGGLPTEVAPQATAEAKMNILNGGFDLSKAIVKNIIDGKTVATIDQQPFYQGFLTVTELYYAVEYGLSPPDVNTGAALVDASNAAKVLELSDTVR